MWMLLHGFTGSPRSWDAVIDLIDLDPAPVRPVLAGHGPDWRNDRAVSFSAEVDRLASKCSSLRRPRLIAGYSLGARLALGILAEHPGRFDGALLIGVHSGLTDEIARIERRRHDTRRAHMLRAKGLQQFVAQWETEPIFQTQRELFDDLLEQQRQIRLGHTAPGLAHSLEVLGLAEMPEYGEALSSSDVPVTLMAGSRDQKFRHLALGLADRSALLDAVIVEGAGHNVVLEAPDAVATAMRALEERVMQGAGS